MTKSTDSLALWSSTYNQNKVTTGGRVPSRTEHLLPPSPWTQSGRQWGPQQPGKWAAHTTTSQGPTNQGLSKDGAERGHSPPLGQILKALC